jgi:hypothetical protein
LTTELLIVNVTSGPLGYTADEIFAAVKAVGKKGNVKATIVGKAFHIEGANIHLCRIYARLTGEKTSRINSPTILFRRSE